MLQRPLNSFCYAPQVTSTGGVVRIYVRSIRLGMRCPSRFNSNAPLAGEESLPRQVLQGQKLKLQR